MPDPLDIARRAAQRPTSQRDAFLDGACDGDAALRAQAALHLTRLLSESAAPAPTTAATADLSPTSTLPAPASPSDSLEGPGSSIGPYKLLQLIGEGGFGHVYMAQQSAPVKRKVALKIVKPGMDSRQVVARFESERQALAMMDHPNIARVYDAGTTPTGRPYFVMELVKGVPITDYCDSEKLTTRERLELVIDVCHAVQHAHYKGIVHRDLKPSNVLVTLHDDKPVVKVIDFGIAKAMNQDLTDGTLFTEFKQVLGTPAYMSPEQAAMSGLDVDSRTDIYSLGVLLYELISGTTPFDVTKLKSAGLAEVQRMIKEDEPPRPSTRVGRTRGATPATGTKTTTVEDIARHRRTDPRSLRRLLSGDLDWICMKAMEKDRRRRYESAGAMADDIRRHLAFEPIQARPPSASYRLRKFARRNRAGVAAVGGVLCALLLTLAALGYGLVQVRNERDKTAERETETRAKMLLSTMNAVRLYTTENVRPSLVTMAQPGATVPDYNDHFVKEMVPGFSARQVFINFRDAKTPGAPAGTPGPYSTFVYKEASPNPTNRDNLADEFEAGLVKTFTADPITTELSGIRRLPAPSAPPGAADTEGARRVFYIARPMPIKDARCLDCHTTPETAPPRQLELYSKDGWMGGYHWKMGDIVAAQVVYVPVSEAFRAEHTSMPALLGAALIVSILGAFLAVLFLLRRV